MAHLYRLILCFVLSALSCTAIAQTCQIASSQIGGVMVYGEMNICSTAASRYNPPASVTSFRISNSQIECRGPSKQGDGSTVDAVKFYVDYSVRPCPVCPAGQNFDKSAGKCVEDRSKQKACGADFQFAGWGVGFGKYNDAWALDGKVPSGIQCDAYTDANPGGTGCQVKFSASGYTKNDDGSWTTIGKFSSVAGEKPGEGVPCSPDYEGEGKDVVADKPKDCAGYSGTVNGVEKCIANSQNNGVEFAKTEKTEKKNDGTTVETKVEQKCEGDKCTTTTTTTTKNAAGEVTGVDMNTKTQDKAGFCKENADKCDGKGNPGVAGGTGSKNGSGGEDDEEEKGKFGGSCEAGFTCEGDAIQCAIAKKQHETACTFEDTQNEFYQLFNQNKNKTGNVTEGLPGNKSENILSRISGIGDDFLGSGAACPADRTIAFGFGEVTIPYSTLCPYLELMGRILVVLAALSGASIIIKRES